jgi:hypothetical protein
LVPAGGVLLWHPLRIIAALSPKAAKIFIGFVPVMVFLRSIFLVESLLVQTLPRFDAPL